VHAVSVFFNTTVEGSGTLSWIGDTALTPVRYLFRGKSVWIEPDVTDESKIYVDHVASFHKTGSRHSSKTEEELCSSSTGMFKTLIAIVCLIPGLIIGLAFKMSAYLFFDDIRKNHDFVKQHFTPIHRMIGTAEEPISSVVNLKNALQGACTSNTIHCPTSVLHIHCNATLTVDQNYYDVAEAILKLNPKKLILEGLNTHEVSLNALKNTLSTLAGKYKWEIHTVDSSLKALTMMATKRRENGKFPCLILQVVPKSIQKSEKGK
jgi:hypothetical protein